MTVALAHAVYLPAAQCFALAPGLRALRRSGSSSAAVLDYDDSCGAVTLSAGRAYRCSSPPPLSFLVQNLQHTSFPAQIAHEWKMRGH